MNANAYTLTDGWTTQDTGESVTGQPGNTQQEIHDETENDLTQIPHDDKADGSK
jgi:hypothetical protein